MERPKSWSTVEIRWWWWRWGMVLAIMFDGSGVGATPTDAISLSSVSSSLSSVPSPSKEQFTFYDKRQEEYVKQLDHYIFTVPTRVTSEGDYVTNNLHARHSVVKRHAGSDPASPASSGSLASTPKESPESLGSDVIHYKIPVHDGKEVIVRVRENWKLLAPGAVVETKTRRYRNASDSEFRTLLHREGCHLAGSVVGDRKSRVALAACAGLSGFFQTNGEQFIIEPLKGHNSSLGSEHPHIVYKRSALPPHLNFGAAGRQHDSKDGSCGVKDHEVHVALQEREGWERQRRTAVSHEEGEATVEDREPQRSSRRRKKRSISSEKNVETLIVVDPEMMRYYQNEDIENYVLTVMNMVSTLFHDASIGNAVNIVIVRMMLLKDVDEELQITHHADKTLRSFCKWQKTINFRDDDHPNHHDVALLLTRTNICNRLDQPCSTLGLAQVSGMCQPHRSCNINEDTGLSLAWTVTHELGHNFAMKHDTKHNDCQSSEDEMFVMAPHLSWDLIPSRWSSCSRQSITKFLDRDWGYCLDDEPGKHEFEYPVLPAGTMYDADHQCRLLYGEDAALCGGVQDLENICSTLWCRVDNKCSTKLQPAAEGTICGSNKWCFAGKCVEIGDRPQAINGQWGQWAEWTPCSRTCGAGITHSERHCNHPPPSNGGNYCLGERKRFRICNTEPCPEDGISFRQVQCSEFNEIPYKGVNYEWIPVPTPDTPCELHCKPKDMFFSVLLKDLVTDGTPCVPGARHMCISGRCRHVGCDWEIESSATEDRCGVCYGDGSTCTTVKQQFNETKEHGYVEATVIPRGARNIRVEEVAGASNFLALRNDQGEYYLNGHWFIQWSGDYEVAGTVVRYDREGNKESFRAPGPLKEPLHIMLLMQTHNPGVSFEYTVPIENVTDSRQPEFRWEYTDWSHCTLSCGGGTQRSEIVCLEKEAGRVDDMFCDVSTKPDDKLRSCNDHLCPARWWTGPWQHCSVTCGPDGTHRRSVMCVRSLGEDEQMALEDSACESLRKPEVVEPCPPREPCPGTLAFWLAGNWTKCNGNPCAQQTRTVVCSNPTLTCDPATRPEDGRPCTNLSCGTWQAGEWTSCSRPCQGVQTRKVSCVGGSRCDSDHVPPAQQTCGNPVCPEPKEDHARANGSDAVTETLPAEGGGRPNSSAGSPTKESLALKALKDSTAPTSRLDKSLSDVVLSDSGEILREASSEEQGKSSSNGGSGSGSKATLTGNDKASGDNSLEPSTAAGNVSARSHGPEQEREVKAAEKVEVAGDTAVKESDQVAAPVNGTSHAVAETDPSEDGYEWYAGEWRQCTRECGGGVQTRTVACFSKSTGTRTDDRLCGIHTKASALQDCNTQPCALWRVSEWRECSATCGYALRQREVTCPEGGLCDSSQRPGHVEVCSSLTPCVAWVTGDWSQCTKTCDGGTQHRIVECVNMTSQQISFACDGSIRPSERQSCNKEDCPSTDSAFTENCETNEISYKVCRMLKKVGLCHKDYVQAKCCRTCADHSRESPANRIADLR